MNIALSFAAAVVIAYGFFAFLLWRYQERIVFQPPLWPASPEDDAPRLSFPSADGIGLFAFVVGERRSNRPPAIGFPGNALVARAMIPWTRGAARRLHVCVVRAECRGDDGPGGSATHAPPAPRSLGTH